MNWEGSAHQVNNKACTDCHTAHAAKDPVTVKFTQPDKCFTCHARYAPIVRVFAPPDA